MRITFARFGVLAVATALLSLAPLLGRARRPTLSHGEFLDPESGEGVSYDSLVLSTNGWPGEATPRREFR